jgi:sulfur-oxidizing protein SoxZ
MTTPPRVKVPNTIRAGDIIEVRTVVRHPMERGEHKDARGKAVARNIIHTFSAVFDGKTVFHADLGTGISANPFIGFHMRVPTAGELVLTWKDDAGQEIVARQAIVLTD